MTYLTVFGVILGAILQLTLVLSQSQTYRAALPLYKPDNPSPRDSPEEDVQHNMANYVKYIEKIKDKADIIIFPEYGLNNIDVMDKLVVHLDSYSLVVEDVGHQYNCSQKLTNDNLLSIACSAKANEVYVILNLAEKVNSTTYYVTNVGIDSHGTICLKCRKRHLNIGSYFKQAPNRNSCSFTANFKKSSTDFAVIYETDMLYAIPDNLKKNNIIMTSAISNTLPFEYGPSLHAGFAINNNVNLIVSAYSDSKERTNGYGGSGIYLQNGTSIVAFDSKPDNQSLIKEIPSIINSNPKKSVDVQIEGITPNWNLKYLNTSNNTSNNISNSEKSFQKCLEEEQFCCKFEADVSQDNIDPYRWVVQQTNSTMLQQQVDVFICALVKKEVTSKTLSFENVNITSTVQNHPTIQTLPIGVNSKYSLTKSEYVIGQAGEITLKLLQKDEILSFGIIRIVGKHSSGNSHTTGIIIGIVIGILVVLGLVSVAFWWYKRNGGYMRPGK